MHIPTWLRTTTELLLRGKVIRRRLPKRFDRRPLYVSPDSALSYMRPRWADAFADLLEVPLCFAAPGQTVWDIGGNVGVFSLASAHCVGSTGEVVVVKPGMFLASLLQRMFAMRENNDVRANVICAAVAELFGLARLAIARRGRSAIALEDVTARQQAGGVREWQHVPVITLDGMLAHGRPPALVKIDVEGAEEMVLRGASRLLADVRPTIYVEVGGEQQAGVPRILHDSGYRLYEIDGPNVRDAASCPFNTLARPGEKSLASAGRQTAS